MRGLRAGSRLAIQDKHDFDSRNRHRNAHPPGFGALFHANQGIDPGRRPRAQRERATMARAHSD